MTRTEPRIDRAFSAISDRMTHVSAPGRSAIASESIASLIAKVDAAKQRYQPGAR